MTGKRILLDENLSPKLRQRLSLRGNSVVTMRYKGWDGKKNGELIALAENDGFDVLVTRDQNLSYQQNMKSRRMALVVVVVKNSATRTALDRKKRNTQEQIILHNADRILAAIDATKFNDYIEVVLETFDFVTRHTT